MIDKHKNNKNPTSFFWLINKLIEKLLIIFSTFSFEFINFKKSFFSNFIYNLIEFSGISLIILRKIT